MKATKVSRTLNPRREAFTRLELAMVLGALALLASIALPVLANTAPRSDRIMCFNNLRQISGAYNRWTTDHDSYGRMPWLVPNPPGNRNLFNFHNLYFQYSWLSNELGTPKILSDPADPRRNARVATSWGISLRAGFFILPTRTTRSATGSDCTPTFFNRSR